MTAPRTPEASERGSPRHSPTVSELSTEISTEARAATRCARCEKTIREDNRTRLCNGCVSASSPAVAELSDVELSPSGANSIASPPPRAHQLRSTAAQFSDEELSRARAITAATAHAGSDDYYEVSDSDSEVASDSEADSERSTSDTYLNDIGGDVVRDPRWPIEKHLMSRERTYDSDTGDGGAFTSDGEDAQSVGSQSSAPSVRPFVVELSDSESDLDTENAVAPSMRLALRARDALPRPPSPHMPWALRAAKSRDGSRAVLRRSRSGTSSTLSVPVVDFDDDDDGSAHGIETSCARRVHLLERLRRARDTLEVLQMQTAHRSAQAQVAAGQALSSQSGEGKMREELAGLAATVNFLARLALERATDLMDRERKAAEASKES